MRRWLAGVAGTLVLALAACGGGSPDDDEASTEEVQVELAASIPPAARATVVTLATSSHSADVKTQPAVVATDGQSDLLMALDAQGRAVLLSFDTLGPVTLDATSTAHALLRLLHGRPEGGPSDADIDAQMRGLPGFADLQSAVQDALGRGDAAATDTEVLRVALTVLSQATVEPTSTSQRAGALAIAGAVHEPLPHVLVEGPPRPGGWPGLVSVLQASMEGGVKVENRSSLSWGLEVRALSDLAGTTLPEGLKANTLAQLVSANYVSPSFALSKAEPFQMRVYQSAEAQRANLRQVLQGLFEVVLSTAAPDVSRMNDALGSVTQGTSVTDVLFDPGLVKKLWGQVLGRDEQFTAAVVGIYRQVPSLIRFAEQLLPDAAEALLANKLGLLATHYGKSYAAVICLTANGAFARCPATLAFVPATASLEVNETLELTSRLEARTPSGEVTDVPGGLAFDVVQASEVVNLDAEAGKVLGLSAGSATVTARQTELELEAALALNVAQSGEELEIQTFATECEVLDAAAAFGSNIATGSFRLCSAAFYGERNSIRVRCRGAACAAGRLRVSVVESVHQAKYQAFGGEVINCTDVLQRDYGLDQSGLNQTYEPANPLTSRYWFTLQPTYWLKPWSSISGLVPPRNVTTDFNATFLVDTAWCNSVTSELDLVFRVHDTLTKAYTDYPFHAEVARDPTP